MGALRKEIGPWRQVVKFTLGQGYICASLPQSNEGIDELRDKSA